jgi:hypothetical protein
MRTPHALPTQSAERLLVFSAAAPRGGLGWHRSGSTASAGPRATFRDLLRVSSTCGCQPGKNRQIASPAISRLPTRMRHSPPVSRSPGVRVSVIRGIDCSIATITIGMQSVPPVFDLPCPTPRCSQRLAGQRIARELRPYPVDEAVHQPVATNQPDGNRRGECSRSTMLRRPRVVPGSTYLSSRGVSSKCRRPYVVGAPGSGSGSGSAGHPERGAGLAGAGGRDRSGRAIQAPRAAASTQSL